MSSEVLDRNVFILGAGFSRDAGAPLIHDFLDRSREFFDDPQRELDTDERKQFSEVFTFKREVAKAREKFRIDLDNIEELFGLVEMSHRLGAVPVTTRDATVYLIAKTLQLSVTHSTRPRVRFILNSGSEARSLDMEDVMRVDANHGIFETDIYTQFALLVRGAYDDPRRLSARASTVISFNYDLVVDDALLRTGAKPDYGLGSVFRSGV